MSQHRDAAPNKITKQCGTCGRFRSYDAADTHCMVCGSDSLGAGCECGRSFDYALNEPGDLYCPGCGKVLRGRSSEFE